jgi:hypothetical protein
MVCITDKHTYNKALLYLLDILSKLYKVTMILKLDDQNLFSGTKKHYSHFYTGFLEFFCARFHVKKSSSDLQKNSKKFRL